MRVVFDSSPAPFTPGGTRTYTEQLGHHLQIVGHERQNHVAVSHLPHWIQPDSSKGIVHKGRVLAWDSYYMQTVLPQRAVNMRADLLHTPAGRTPLFSRVPAVTTLLDVIPFIFPQFFRVRDRIMLKLNFTMSSRKAQHILTISEQSRQDIQHYLNVPEDRITVTYPGVDPLFHSMDLGPARQTVEKYGVQQPYILCVGTLEPRKNFAGVLRAFSRLRKKGTTDRKLVIVGKRGWLEDEILRMVRDSEVRDSIHITGYIAQADLPAFYCCADVFVYPSFYEGFGLPPLEAMACGCPVITSSTSSLPEVTGNAGILVDPYDVMAIAHAIEHVLADTSMAAAMRERGLQRAEQFSWLECARKTFDVYEQVITP